MTRQNATRPIRDAEFIDLTPLDRRGPPLWRVMAVVAAFFALGLIWMMIA